MIPTLGQAKKDLITYDIFKEILGILPKNTWLIHFTTKPKKLIQEGFLFGLEEEHPEKTLQKWCHTKPTPLAEMLTKACKDAGLTIPEPQNTKPNKP